MSETVDPVIASLEAVARDAPDEKLVEGAAENVGEWATICEREIDRRAAERARRELLPSVLQDLPVEAEQLLVDAIRLRRIALELYGEADIHMRSKQPRFRRANTVIQDTGYLVGGESICTGQPNCTCKACETYTEWMYRDQEERDAGDAQERAAGGRRLEE